MQQFLCVVDGHFKIGTCILCDHRCYVDEKAMWMAVIAASVATIFLYGLSPDVAVHGIIKGATARATVETLVVFYSITFLQRMMEKRKNLSNAQVAMNGLFNNNR